MSKDKQLMELVTQDLITKFVQDTGNSISDAMTIFYNSVFFEKLYDKETGLYLEGSDYLYEILGQIFLPLFFTKKFAKRLLNAIQCGIIYNDK